MGDYFKTYNFTVGFTFEELDLLIDRIAKVGDREKSSSNYFACILVRVISFKPFLLIKVNSNN